jgi:hypothetical protein
VLRGYFDDPDNYIAPAERKTIRISTPHAKKMALPLVAGLLILAVVGGFVGTMMTHKTKPEETAAVQTSQQTAREPVSPPATVSSAAKPADESELKPLAAGGQTLHPSPAHVVKPAGSGASERALPAPAVRQDPTLSAKPLLPGRKALSIDQLAVKYGSKDLLTIGRSALKACKPSEAVIALEALSDSDTDVKTRNLLLLEAYLEAGRAKDALFIATSQSIQDAQFDVLCGRLYRTLGKSQNALECLENALTKPSAARSRLEIRNDALFYTALARGDLYRKDPTGDNREQAVNGWNIVKKMYAENQSHARFRQAENELSLLK